MSRYGEMRYNLENIDKIEKDDTLVYSWKTSVGKTIEIWFENKVIIGTILNIKNKKCQIKTSCGFEFYLTNFKFDYLLTYDHHNVLGAVGDAAEHLQMFKENENTL